MIAFSYYIDYESKISLSIRYYVNEQTDQFCPKNPYIPVIQLGHLMFPIMKKHILLLIIAEQKLSRYLEVRNVHIITFYAYYIDYETLQKYLLTRSEFSYDTK